METHFHSKSLQKRCVMDNVNGMRWGKLNKNTFVLCTDLSKYGPYLSNLKLLYILSVISSAI